MAGGEGDELSALAEEKWTAANEQRAGTRLAHRRKGGTKFSLICGFHNNESPSDGMTGLLQAGDVAARSRQARDKAAERDVSQREDDRDDRCGVLCAAEAPAPDVTMTSTFNRTNSAAISAARELCPSAQRYSIATVRPSTQPRSCSRCRKAATHWPIAEGVLEPKNPMVGSFPGCCARAVSGHAAAPPSSVMNSRRFTQ